MRPFQEPNCGLPWRWKAHETRHGLAVACNHDFLSCLDLRELARQVGLRLTHIHH